MLDGLVALTAAERGACAVIHDGRGEAPVVLSTTVCDPSDRKGRRRRRRPRRKRKADGHGDASRQDEFARALIEHLAASVREAARGNGDAPGGNGHGDGKPWPLITALVPLDRHGSTFGAIALAKPHGDEPFDGEDHRLVQVFHYEMAWVYELDLPLASPEVTSLSPWARETLQYLLAGFSEKQAAHLLKLSHNTVHHYVEQLYRHFGVSSRSELLSRWVRERPDNPNAGPPPVA